MEVLRLGVESELQLLTYTTATATQELSHICDLHHSSQQRQILNPLSKARDQNHILADPGWIRYHWATTGTPLAYFNNQLDSLGTDSWEQNKRGGKMHQKTIYNSCLTDPCNTSFFTFFIESSQSDL